jgi:hypothetical protein
MPLDFVHRHLDEILLYLSFHRLADMFCERVAKNAERARRRYHDQRFCFPSENRFV